jgi:AcrR family transcriptional regulator
VTITEFSRPAAHASSTRERILREASILFTQHGYFGTSTREIAGAVGIRQPSIFHHFDNKAAIAEELLEYGWGSTLSQLRQVAALDEPAEVRLYTFCRWAMVHVVTSPYQLVGLTDYNFLNSADGQHWLPRFDAITKYLRDIITDGVASGVFIKEDPEFIRLMVVGSLNAHHRIKTMAPSETVERDAEKGADYILRAIMADSTRLDSVRTASLALAGFVAS